LIYSISKKELEQNKNCMKLQNTIQFIFRSQKKKVEKNECIKFKKYKKNQVPIEIQLVFHVSFITFDNTTSYSTIKPDKKDTTIATYDPEE